MIKNGVTGRHDLGEAATSSVTAVDLWHALADAYADLEVASRHALDDFELRPEDAVAFDTVAELRSAFEALIVEPDGIDDHGLLDDIGRRLASMEARIEILHLAAG